MCLFACLRVCLFASACVCLFLCFFVCLFAGLFACLPVSLFAGLFVVSLPVKQTFPRQRNGELGNETEQLQGTDGQRTKGLHGVNCI